MQIIAVNIENTKDIKNIMNLIHDTFLSSNIQDSTEGLIKRMKVLYSPENDYTYTLAHFKKSTLFFVAKEQEEIIGMIRGTKDKIINLYVTQKYQGQGIGHILLETFEQAAKKLGSTIIQLKSSKYALPFYAKNGYIVDHHNRLIKYI